MVGATSFLRFDHLAMARVRPDFIVRSMQKGTFHINVRKSLVGISYVDAHCDMPVYKFPLLLIK